MTPPARLGDGTEVSFKGISEVRKGDGAVLWSADAIPDSGISRYEFEQDVTDSWGGNDGTDNTSAGYTTDAAVGDYAKSFDGVDDQVTTGYTADFGTDAFTVAGWMRVNDFADDSPLANTYDDSTGWILDARASRNGSTGRFWVDGSELETSSLNTGTWYHLAGVRDSGELRLYLDGSSVNSLSVSAPDASSSEDMVIGRRPDGTNQYHGDIDDLRIYSKALTDSEVSDLYSTGGISG